MTKECLDSNLHNYSGTSQQQRALGALASAYAQVDERSITDLILFAQKYGAYLNYYNLSNTVAGNWQGFMSTDIAVSIASVASINMDDCYSYLNSTLYPYILTPVSPYASPQQTFKFVFDLIASLAYQVNQAFINIPVDSDYYQFLNVSIGSKLATPLKLLWDYYANYLAVNYPAVLPASPIPDPRSPIGNTVYITALNFLNTAPWYVAPTAIPNPLQAIIFDTSSIAQSNGNSDKQISSSSVFTGTVNSFLNGLAYIVNYTATTELQEIISQYPDHTPHYALYLAFLQLFKSAQKHLNEYTGRHLKFYYEKVLDLKPNPGVPDDVYVGFTLQSNTPQHLLPQGTQLQAGKDAKGDPLFYGLTNSIVLNQASVDEQKSLYLVKNSNPAVNPLNLGTATLYASPTANSADGVGGKITNPDGSWYPFGDLNNPVFNSSPPPAIGFAMASDLLYLNEGTRTVSLTFGCANNLVNPRSLNQALSAAFSVQFTGNKNWFDASSFVVTGIPAVDVEISNSELVITITISANAPPIVPYSQKIHGGNWPQALPMVQMLLTDMRYYSVLKSLAISSVEIDVQVDKIKNLIVQNNDGKIDTSKPFKPFGAFPGVGASIIIGNKEVFQKPLTSLTVTLDTLNFPNVPATLYLDAYLLSNGAWDNLSGGINNPFTITASVTVSSYKGVTWETYTPQSYPLSIYDKASQLTLIPNTDFTPNELYSSSSQNGFVQLALANTPTGATAAQDLSLSAYLTASQAAVAKTSVNITTNGPTTTYQLNAPATPPPVPSSPTANSIYLTYEANVTFLDQASATFNATTDYEQRQNYLYHIEPFGYREMHPFLFPPASKIPSGDLDDQINFLPVFNLDNGTNVLDTGTVTSTDNGGELWIGLTGAVPGETHSILFQLSEGSSNPLKATTPVSWYYLSANNWISLGDKVVDQTHNLSQSGLVIFPLPGDETLTNTRADSGLVWVKAVVQTNTDSVCRIISIITNTAEAQFVQNIPNNIQFSGNIPASTISKLAVPDGTIKQVSQPYPSFGGMVPENSAMFDQRVSERLRHKNRAVASWDYERLVLQNFPQIHKVKCINHTNLNTNTQAYSELKPGHVMIVTVPDLSLLTGANPFLPFTNIGLLNDIKQFIEPLTSPFVKLKVENPQFEGVQFQFDVSFKVGLDVNYYTGQLNTDIMNFLMPWASGSSGQDIEFGGTIEKSAVLNFVQTRSYVDYVTCFQMNQYIYGETGFTIYQSNIEEAVATTARSILVPYYIPGIIPVGNLIESPANCTC